MIQEIIQANHFTLLRQREIAEMQGTLWEMAHEQSGAKLCWLQRADENMTFAIAFRTIPTDSTGVFHILEHSVLNGSDKYPVKEPFVELLKSSLQTFLNAMTYPDKTVYPVSSRNKQDFHNLMDVYMDAVLHPLAVKMPNVFRQEGWRLEFDEQGEPMFQGVVYNEMKGAYSDVSRMAERAMMAGLYPDTCYAMESGGDPVHIPELSYEQFVSEHQKYYHPSNALIVLDGNVDLQDCLHLLDKELSRFQKQEMSFPIPMQQPLPYRQERIRYEVAEGEDDGKAIVSFGKLLCRFDDPVELQAANLLADYLAGDAEAPLKRAILNAGLGEDFQVEVSDGMQQAWFGWQVWNTREEKIPEIKQTIRSALEELLHKGLDKERLLGCYNALAFKLLDRDNYGPRGLVEALNILEPWLYDGDPAQNLHYRSHLERLKEKLDSGYLEQLISRLLLREEDGFMAVLVPDVSLGKHRTGEERQQANRRWASLTTAQQTALKAELDALHQWQQTPDSPEALRTMPMLTLADIQGDPQELPCTVTQRGENAVLVHDLGSDLCYMNLHFEASDIAPDELNLLGLTAGMLGLTDTEAHTAAQLQNLTRQILGDYSINPQIFHVDRLHHRMVVTVSGVCLDSVREQAAALLLEILTSTRFRDADAVLKYLRRKKAANQQRLIASGNRYAAMRVAAQQSSAGVAREQLGGCEDIRWTAECAQKSPAEIQALLPRMEALCKKLFCKQRLTVSLSRSCETLADTFLAAFPEGTAAPETASFSLRKKQREGIRIPAGVGYAAKGANIEAFDAHFDGQMYVLSNLLTFEYLWTEVRVKGGAYGTGFRISPANDLVASSYRDPSPAKTLGIFDQCADAVRQLCSAGTDLTKYILGAMTDADPLLGAAATMLAGESRFFRHRTQADVIRTRRALLGCQPETLLALCPMLEAAARQGSSCIIAGQQQLDASADQIDTMVDIPC